MDRLEELRAQALGALQSASTPEDVEKTRIALLGRKGALTEILRSIPTLPAEERPVFGKRANEMKVFLEGEIAARLKQLSEAEDTKKLGEFFDVTIPGARRPRGSVHPVAQVRRSIEQVATSMGFMILDGPEVETDFYNFEAVNIPSTHPARDTMDTFWLKNGNLLRTHTSPVQVRAMQKFRAPLKCIVPGRVFRYEATDASHENTFAQCEGLMVDRGISVANLIAVMKQLLSGVFGREIEIRLRPGYYPFVEPGFDLDGKCVVCSGRGCSMCKQTGWVELAGSGMVHPNVLRAGNVDPKEFSGFAFGMGLDRIAIMRYGIEDIRLFLGGDLRFLEQF
jgi:phenylalanyl-tRNA synthetase alpha chain